MQGVSIYVCTQPLTSLPGVIPPTPLATIFSDPNGAVPLANPVTSDGNGNFFFYAAPGTYTLIFFDSENRIPTQTFPDQVVVSPGAGTVTSVAMTGDGVLLNSVVPGSPVSTTGTLAPTVANAAANKVFAGPSSGAAAPMAPRSLVTADLPAGVGTVTSVAGTITINNPIITGSIAGSPITVSGTLAITLSLANQNANTILAGPTSGGAGPVTARLMVPADLPPLLAVAFSATPTFNALVASTFTMTLTGNVTSSTVTNPTTGQKITFILTQDGTGGRTFAWPANFHGTSLIGPEANSVSVQEFQYDGAAWRGVSPGQWSAS